MLARPEAKRVDLLWSVMFVIISVIYRPIEQLLSRTIAERRARGHSQHSLRVPMLIQGGFALLFLALALALHDAAAATSSTSTKRSTGSSSSARSPTRASYFARGWLAGHERFGLFGGLVLMESLSRLCFALAVALGIASGRDARSRSGSRRRRSSRSSSCPPRSRRRTPIPIAQGAPITVDEADAALAGPGTEGVQETAAHEDLSLRRGGGFAAVRLGDHALRADAAERGGADRRRDRPRTSRSPGSCSTCC